MQKTGGYARVMDGTCSGVIDFSLPVLILRHGTLFPNLWLSSTFRVTGGLSSVNAFLEALA
jgi:hypothetical protein